MGRKTPEKQEVVDNLDKFYLSREEIFNYFKDYTKIMLDAGYKAKLNATEGTELKILTPKQLF